MTNPTVLHWIDGILLVTLLGGAPAIAFAIACRAYEGHFKSFSRETFITAFVLTGLAGVSLILLAIRMQADVRTWLYGMQLLSFIFGAVLVGVSSGFVLAIFTRRLVDGPNSDSDNQSPAGQKL